MADQVTISTFLELRDNLSEGMRKAAAAIEAATGRVRKARSDEERAAARAAKAEERAAKEAIRNQLRMHKEIERMTNQRERENAREDARQANRANQQAKEAARMQERITAAQYREEIRRITLAERAEQRKVRVAEAAARERARIEESLARKAAMADRAHQRDTERTARQIIAAHRREARERERLETKITTAMWKAKERRIAIAQREAAERKRITDRMAVDSWLAQNKRMYGEGGKQAAGGGRGLMREVVIGDLVASGIKAAVSGSIDALSYAFKEGIAVNRKYEQSVSAISGALYTMNISPSMQIAEQHTEKVLGTLRRLAAVLPGEAADYVEVYQRTIPAALQSGLKDTQKYAEFVSKYTAVAIQRGVGARVAATNLQILLQGTARAGTKMAQVLSAYTGKTINEINRMSREARLNLLVSAVDQAASGMESAMDKFDAVYGTFKTNMEDLFRLSTKPLFEDIKGILKDINVWFDANKTAAIELGQTLSESVGSTLYALKDTAKELFNIISDSNTKLIKKMTPEERMKRLSKLEKSAGEFRGSDFIPFYGFFKRYKEYGDIENITKEIEKDVKETKKYAKANREFQAQKKKLGLDVVAPATGTFEDITAYTQGLISSGFFKDYGKPLKLAVSDFLMEVSGINADTVQRVWQTLGQRKVPGVDIGVAAPQAPGDRARTYNDFRNSNFNIKQEFAEGFDPDRIAFAFANDLGRLADMKLQAAYSLTPGSVR